MKKVKKQSLRLTERIPLMRLACFALFVCMVVLYSCDKPKDDSTKTDPTGPGSAANPFKVASAADLKRVGSGEKGPEGVAWADNKCYLQTDDIDLSDETNWKSISETKGSNNFSGTYDGDGHTISNLTVVAVGDYDNIGLFGAVYGTIKNVRLDGVNLSAGSADFPCAGGIAGRLMNNGKIDHCSVNDITIDCNGAGEGAVAGQVIKGTVTNCIATNGVINGGMYCGGVTGINTGTIENCYSTIDVNGNWAVGGIAGGNHSGNGGTIQYCYVTGNVSVTSESMQMIGGINGSNGGTIQNCVALNKEVHKSESGNSGMGRIIGFVFSEESKKNNYARPDIKLTAGSSNITITDATTTNKNGADVLPANYNGANSGTWWSSVAKFPASSWDFAAGRLPHLKGFDGLTQNPTVTPSN